MNESRAVRPTLATVICVYEGVLLTIRPLMQWYLRSTQPVRRYHAYPTHPLQSALWRFGPALAIAAIVALWQMRCVAFVLFLARYRVSAALIVRGLPFMMKTYRLLFEAARTIGNYWPVIVLFGVIAAEWVLNLLITCYVYKITSPPKRSPPPYCEPGMVAQ